MRKVRMGMVGGGIGAFIGGVHRMAAALDGHIELVCGAFSSDPERSYVSGKNLMIDPSRVYGSYLEMMEKERALPDSMRMDLVSIVTPNHVHYAPARAALEHGFHVICDKPLAFDLDEAHALKKIVASSNKLFALTHNYTGYPLVKQARYMVRNGELGKIRKVIVEYPQGWLTTLLENSGHKQAAWRTDPSRSGIAGAMGDIGSHAENLAEYITGLKISELCADVGTMVAGRKLDDDGSVLLRFENGARGILMASQICTGEQNDLNIRIYGDKAGIEWRQMNPNILLLKFQDKPDQILRTGSPYLCEAAKANTRFPPGHPEGYLEAFANIYRNLAKCIQADWTGDVVDPIYLDFPDIEDGVRGMEFIYKVIESSNSNAKWIKF